MYHVIYDGNCNLCVNLVRLLENLDQGKQFCYTAMQEAQVLDTWGITPKDCEMGMILLNPEQPGQRWQGSDAAEEIGRLLPFGSIFVEAYRALPGAKWVGDRVYEQIRDNRYLLFGQRASLYQSTYPACDSGQCHPEHS
ncbi:MAG TPA: DCC1-like thiol-disulfide oxidoreductase family protein [Trichocoleus sp.]|jgi:predicted DCC family thiol-disulfide oxidoreductase YuxK